MLSRIIRYNFNAYEDAVFFAVETVIYGARHFAAADVTAGGAVNALGFRGGFAHLAEDGGKLRL